MQYKHIVFDIDGTLTDTDYAVLTSLKNLLKRRQGKEYALEELTFVKGIPGVVAFAQLGIEEKDYDTVMREWEEGMRAMNDTITVYPGAQQMLEALQNAGVGLGIATSKTRDQYNKDFCRFEIAKYFEFSITCEETDDPKPGAGPLLAYMHATGAKPEEMLYIGDSVYDAMCAKAAGVDFALATWGTSDMNIAAKWRPQTLMALLEMIR
ncbi:MAG: HAD family hydrolase [Clostridia bacterium]|nr:HAD family hydrolase [Clostridia bacterium]